MNKEILKRLREEYPVGTRVELIKMDDPYSKLEPGDQGFVTGIDDCGTIFVAWNRGSSLGLIFGVDQYKKI